MIKVTYKSRTDNTSKTITADHLSTVGFTNGDFALLDETNRLISVRSLLNIISIEMADEEEYQVSRAEGQND